MVKIQGGFTKGSARLPLALCGMVALTLMIWSAIEPPGWDVGVYRDAIRSLAAGHDPYMEAMAIQEAFHRQAVHAADAEIPFGYVYSPVTLPILRIVGLVPGWLSVGIYLLLYLFAAIAQIWVTMSAGTMSERRYLAVLAPISIFFPGLLASGIVNSGNVAYVLYAAVLLCAARGWRQEKWGWFYVSVVVASCVKAPFLGLLAIPVLSTRGQWRWASLAAGSGVSLFAVQPVFWPTLFHHYLQAIDMQVSFNHDFGCGPAGLFSGFLQSGGGAFSRAGTIFYLCYAIPLFLWAVYLSRLYLRGRICWKEWMPVMLVGVFLLNPRIIEYDLAPVTIPLGLIAWRFLNSITSRQWAIVALSTSLAALNALALTSWNRWKWTEGPLLVFLFLAGSWSLVRIARGHRPDVGVPDAADADRSWIGSESI